MRWPTSRGLCRVLGIEYFKSNCALSCDVSSCAARSLMVSLAVVPLIVSSRNMLPAPSSSSRHSLWVVSRSMEVRSITARPIKSSWWLLSLSQTVTSSSWPTWGSSYRCRSNCSSHTGFRVLLTTFDLYFSVPSLGVFFGAKWLFKFKMDLKLNVLPEFNVGIRQTVNVHWQ